LLPFVSPWIALSESTLRTSDLNALFMMVGLWCVVFLPLLTSVISRYSRERKVLYLPTLVQLHQGVLRMDAPHSGPDVWTFDQSDVVEVSLCDDRLSIETTDGRMTDFFVPWEAPTTDRELEDRIRRALRLPESSVNQ
jgi:hypothetical protein